MGSGAVAAARSQVQVDPATRAQAPARRPAERLHRNFQVNLLRRYLLQIDGVPIVDEPVVQGVVRYVDLLPFVRSESEEEVQLAIHRETARRQAPGAGNLDAP